MEEQKIAFNKISRGKIACLNNLVVMIGAFQHLDEVNCSICLDFIVECRVAVCGHTFC